MATHPERELTSLDIRMDLDETPWPDVDENTLPGVIERIGLLHDRTSGNRPAVAIAVRMPDGTLVTALTTWRLLGNAVNALHIRHPYR